MPGSSWGVRDAKARDAKGRGGKGGKGDGKGGGKAFRVVPVAQAHVDKVLAKVVQPLSRLYNGQGCVVRHPQADCTHCLAHSHFFSLFPRAQVGAAL